MNELYDALATYLNHFKAVRLHIEGAHRSEIRETVRASCEDILPTSFGTRTYY
jgi:hypothetical protein